MKTVNLEATKEKICEYLDELNSKDWVELHNNLCSWYGQDCFIYPINDFKRMLSDNEVKRLFEYVDNQDSLNQIRDSAIFSVMIGTGLRRGEVAKLTTLNLFLDEKIPFLRVIGKGNKERQLTLHLNA